MCLVIDWMRDEEEGSLKDEGQLAGVNNNQTVISSLLTISVCMTDCPGASHQSLLLQEATLCSGTQHLSPGGWPQSRGKWLWDLERSQGELIP